MSGPTFAKALLISLLAAGGALGASPARAEVRHLGDWQADPVVTLDLDRTPRDEAVKRLAAAAGWSLVSTVPPGEPIDIHVRGQRAGKILDLLLTDGDYVATRDEGLLSVRRVAPGQALPPATPVVGAVPPVPPVPPVPAGDDPPEPAEPPEPPEPPDPPEPPASPHHDHGSRDHGADREVFGNNLRIEKSEVVNNVSVVGGNVDVLGTIKGDLVVTSGNIIIRREARVMGDVTAMSGNVTIEDHARVDGDVGTVGGVLKRGAQAEIHGDIKVDDRDHGNSKPDTASEGSNGSGLRRALNDAGDAVTGAALLFVFGAVLLSLATSRMEKLKVEIASRPMRSFAMGVVAVLGWFGLTIALCITVVGIPLAFVNIIGGIVALFAGLAATLETLGSALLGHKTKNPYVHLAFGCGLFLVVGALPFVGDLAKLAVVLVGLGSVASTRGAGFFPAKNAPSGSPYRDVFPAM
jgi:hypothetical protein